MKQFFLFVTAVLICTMVSAQKNFQGSVTYRLHASIGDKPDAELKILFGDKKLKLLFKEKDEFDKKALVILLDSAAAYALDPENKTFRKTTLTLTAPAKNPDKKLINGYSTTSFKPENTGLSGLLGGMLGTSNVIFYVADSLYYYIPAAFTGNKELVAIQHNRIVLGAEFQIESPFTEYTDSASRNNPNIITAEAIDIKPMVPDAGEFLIPADYADQKSISYSETSDSTAVMVDTAVIAPPAAKPAKKKPAKRASPKSTSTSKAIRRKDQ
ncbi:MAG: hypothetical protein ACKOU7_01705 [Ferruginibacter sp.]